ncbi:TonB-dependent transferrin-binding protein TbpA [Neisseria gonorrhoeae]|uniref:TonB-dependent transferrin-binding protein TbpA n=1 Tax=Neisseria gonorrhoeae TaxID=485 RepID=UPI000F4E5D43|nr:TonB-dependent transferrin-binding protein TbpA [Neisseria gonorrhoeae]MDO6013588.1 TonB-dependent transferrin-binding protein TbpA [Neisseria gonorrhoeae]ROV21709.1 lactoferrin/transferrin family TonB-dependent receptor [Neisseria gonorrhoeae]URD54142.1 TonB-dependent transferrin-binding protein TbpA [Neisseria gonorrhoeae]URK94756.1 TonB-dependent transferrin-binding protein TbpA [Neisseria gonorrhoeae]
MQQQHLFRFNILCLSLMTALPAYAENVQAGQAQEKQLDTIQVKAKKQKTRRDNEVTGLGKLVKTADTLSKEQVLDIRDLTRYDPGIAVVEQGRGASSGYSIRGMDKNRVALTVDGLAQIQSYTAQAALGGTRTAGSSGAINEIEYENVKAVEISKGSNSVEQGSGALAGSVAFQTKTADDVIGEGRQWGIQSKTAYSGKNRGLTQSIALAGRIGGAEALLIRTGRHAGEIRAHEAAGRGVQSFNRLAPVDDGSDYAYFVVEGECPKGYAACKDKPKKDVAGKDERQTVSTRDYTGPNRFLADPLSYESRSWLFRPGFRFENKRHYIGGILERTQQTFDTRDMTVPAFLTKAVFDENKKYGSIRGYGKYAGDHRYGGLITNSENGAQVGAEYGTGVFYDETHTKSRYGLEYVYTNADKDTWADYARLSYDRQGIGLDNHFQQTHCSADGSDKYCRPSADKPSSYYKSDRVIYGESHRLLQAAFKKSFDTAKIRHNLSVNLGYDRFGSDLRHQDYYYQHANRAYSPKTLPQNGDKKTIPNGGKDKPYWVSIGGGNVVTGQICLFGNNTYTDCTPRSINGKSYYAAVRDNVRLGRWADVGAGLRYDYRSTHSDDGSVSTGTHRTLSWNTGIVLKPADWLDLTYRTSTGFRLPSFAEMYGWRSGDKIKAVKIDPEKSFNKEAGIVFKGDFGNLEASWFDNAYRDLIVRGYEAEIKNGKEQTKGDPAYLNAQSARITGINILGKIDWNGVWDKLPEGWYSTFAYNRVRVRDIKKRADRTDIQSHLFDAIQPSRYVVGSGYDQPEGKWGVNGMLTYSKAKEITELLGSRALLNGNSRDTKATARRTRPWYIVDVSGYYTVKKHFTLRAGVYNLLNHRYVTWENVRQTAAGAVNQHKNVGVYNRYAAPGRNYTFSLEMKF